MPSPTRSNFLISPQPVRKPKMGRTLLVLLWKHFTVRRRRYIMTTIEFVLPVVLFIVIFIFKGAINSLHSPMDDKNSEFSENVVVSPPISIKKLGKPNIVLYYPKNNLTDELMAKVGKSLKLKHMMHYSDSARGYIGMNDKDAIIELLKNFESDKHAFVVFKHMNEDTLPDHLNYTIRMKKNFETQQYAAMDGDIGPHMMFGLDYAVFVRLQYAIDSSYLELRSGTPVQQLVSVQEFPYVSSRPIAAIYVLHVILIYILLVAPIANFDILMARLMQERASGVQELIKMVGVTTRTLGLSHFINVLPAGLIFSVGGATLLTVSSSPLLPMANGFLLWLFLFLFFVSTMALAFLGSYVTNSTDHTTSLATFLYVAALIPAIVVYNRVPNSLAAITGLLPFRPVFLFLDEIQIMEVYGIGLNFKTMMTSHDASSCSVFVTYLLLLVQAGVFFFLAWYCSLVRPGKYGTALPADFLCRREYWTRNEVHPDLDMEALAQDKTASESKYYEPLPPNCEVGIEVDNVTKVFQSAHALNNVSLQVLKGEITMLLGHNGAGKTTLMSIITGMMSATQGRVYVNGLDTVTQQDEVRRNLGFCPQHNLFCPDNTAYEHIMFFSLLKGLTWKKAKESSYDLLAQMGLTSKADSLPSTLSGGMKRRLQLACALAGDASVLVLDEPTSGLDVETRRGLWDLLLSLRSGRTVLLSTHFMEEADALGDRVAALHSGTLRCFATPMHLKKEIDTGYRLSITLKPEAAQAAAEADISQIVSGSLPTATQLTESGERTTAYKLPSRESDKFPEMFKKLESERERLGIESIGVGVSTLEEVFLKLCSDVTTLAPSDEVDATLKDSAVSRRVSGLKLVVQQFIALFIRQIRFALFSWKMFTITQILVPILVLALATHLANDGGRPSVQRNSAAQMNLRLYRDMDWKMLCRIDVEPFALADRLGCTQLVNDNNITSTLIEIARKDLFQYYKYLIGIELNDTDGVAHYTSTVRHALPVAVNVLSNALAATLPAPASITTVNHPVDGAVSYDAPKLKEPKSGPSTWLYAFFIVFCVSLPLFGAGALASRERASSTRHIHVIAGCSPELHWLAALAFHALYAVLALLVPTLAFAAALDKDQTIQQAAFLGPFTLVLLCGALATIAVSYLISFCMNEKHMAFFLLLVFVLFGVLAPSVTRGCQLASDEFCRPATAVLDVTAYAVLPQTFVEAAMRTANIARVNAYCYLNKERCPNLDVNESGFDKYKCCELNVPPQCYLCSESYSPLYYIVALFVQFTVFMMVVVLAEHGILSMWYDTILNCTYKEEPRPRDETLEEERQYVNKAIRKPQGDALLVASVHKRYPTLICGRSVTAVKGISFGVREGECFGLVGVNGAGKSTTFKMLTCETYPTRGAVVANDRPQHLWNNSDYLNGLGYCPQFFGLDPFLTGRQNMELLFTLDGLAKHDAKKEAVAWLELIDLTKHADKKLATYSGGCSRRLSSIAALGRRAPLSLLDEPTAGVDVAARRQLWRAVRAAQAQTTLAGRRRAVLITSHSMDEMEALCARVGIMSAGSLAALGSPAALRAAHTAGLALFIKIKDLSQQRQPTDVTDSVADSTDLQKLKEACYKFKWTPKDEHKTMLNYHVGKELKMEYSALFSQLEELRARFPALVQDYAVTETTLEQVFLQYAKPAAEPVGAHAV